MKEPEIYGDRVELYDRIYHWKDYRSEAEVVHRLLRAHGIEEGARVLEAACGTGNYLLELKRWYEVSGFDLNRPSVELARKKLPEVELVVADMVDFRLENPVDALVCLFSSIGYVYPDSRLGAAAESFYQNVRPGGVALVEPWFQPEKAIPGFFSQQTYDGDDMKLCRAATHQVEGRMSIFDFHWLVTRPEGVEHFVEEHRLWMYTRKELLGAFEAAGFEVEWNLGGPMPGRGLLVARKPGEAAQSRS